jgi:23S rRNA pseudouridine955/2504/2580 synthase
MIDYTVQPDDDGCRFDRLLRRHLARMPLAEIFRIIRTGDARINDRRARGSVRLRSGDRISVRIDTAEFVDDKPGAGTDLASLARTGFFRRSFRVVFEDDALIVCDKPCGLVVHPGSGHTCQDTLIDLAHAYVATAPGGASAHPPLLVHRIDRDTSGLIMIARTRRALRALHASLQKGAVCKRYRLVVHGSLPRRSGTVDVELVKTYDRNDGTKVTVAADGAASRSRYRVLQSARGVSLVEVELDTGRTHQIRVHMNHLGCPVVGDIRYGDTHRDQALFTSLDAERRLYLHAWSLRFPHPLSGETISLSAPQPESFAALVGSPRPRSKPRRR